jgi:hypothetical protein
MRRSRLQSFVPSGRTFTNGKLFSGKPPPRFPFVKAHTAFPPAPFPIVRSITNHAAYGGLACSRSYPAANDFTNGKLFSGKPPPRFPFIKSYPAFPPAPFLIVRPTATMRRTRLTNCRTPCAYLICVSLHGAAPRLMRGFAPPDEILTEKHRYDYLTKYHFVR